MYPAVTKIYPISHVVKVSGFCTDFFSSKYIVAANPTQLHLPEGQEVIRYLSDNIRDKTSYIGKHYTPLKSFSLDENVTAIVYEKKSEYSKEDIIKVRDFYDSLYPEYPELFKDRFNGYIDYAFTNQT